MNKKLEMVWWVCVVLSALGIVGFWVAGFNGNDTAAKYSFFAAGVMAMVAVGAIGLKTLRTRNGSFE